MLEVILFTKDVVFVAQALENVLSKIDQQKNLLNVKKFIHALNFNNIENLQSDVDQEFIEIISKIFKFYSKNFFKIMLKLQENLIHKMYNKRIAYVFSSSDNSVSLKFLNSISGHDFLEDQIQQIFIKNLDGVIVHYDNMTFNNTSENIKNIFKKEILKML